MGGMTGPVTLVAGTRPEAIKLSPLYWRLRAELGEDRVTWVWTGQHMELGLSTLRQFGVTPDITLDIRAHGDDLNQLHALAISEVGSVVAETDPALIVVQGDTLSAFSAAFAAFHTHTPLAHVEAGLRTGNTHNPYPEEAYRRMIDVMADLRFAPTPNAAQNLLLENMRPKTIWVTGNTVVDALMSLDLGASPPPATETRRLLLTTLHRRESWGRTLREMSRALVEIADAHPDVEIVLPLHINPNVREAIRPILRNHSQIRLSEPLDFAACHDLMRRATLILTDSGGIQEEAPSYGVPTLVLRETTERPEVIDSGQALLVGTDRRRIVAEATQLLASPERRAAMAIRANPFGDGQASARIALAIKRYLRGEEVLLTDSEQFRPDIVPNDSRLNVITNA